MTDHDMRALALNLAHTSERVPADVLERAQKYYGFLSRRDEAKAVAAANVANQVNPHALDIRNRAGMTALEMQEAMLGARGE